MRKYLRSTVRVVAVATALATALPLAAAPAHADDIVPLAEDVVALGLDTVSDLARGCTPHVREWTATPFSSTAFVRNNSVWYKHASGGTAKLSCPASVKAVTRLSDFSAPGYPWARGPKTTTYATGSSITGNSWVEAPYVGPDAPILRPYGEVTVHVEVFRKLSTGRYAPVYFGCMEWTYLVQPAASLTVTDPRNQGLCKYDGLYTALDYIEGLDPQTLLGGGEAIEIDVP